jgi:ribosomal protein L37E
MARCSRCDACESQWDFTPCKYCGFPGAETRSPEQVVQDDKNYNERIGED